MLQESLSHDEETFQALITSSFPQAQASQEVPRERICLPMHQTQVRSLGWEDPEKKLATHCRIFAWEIPVARGAWQATVMGRKRVGTQLSMHTTFPRPRAQEKFAHIVLC